MEIWKDVEGYEGLYQISSLGRARSVTRFVKCRGNKLRKINGKILATSVDTENQNYRKICFLKNGVKKRFSIHSLVANAFIEKPTPILNPIVLHGINGSEDNSVENLSWGCFYQNARDKKRDGTDHQLNKTHCPLGHKLEAPNLAAKRKHRNCLSCGRAQAYIYLHGGNLQELSDDYYKKLGMI